jgi:hypothetical protein
MIKGYFFLLQLHNSLYPNQRIGGKYIFVKWMGDGGLQFEINKRQRKSIPPEIIILAFHIHNRNKKTRKKININQEWLKANGYSDWCFIDVLQYLLKTYDIK